MIISLLFGVAFILFALKLLANFVFPYGMMTREEGASEDILLPVVVDVVLGLLVIMLSRFVPNMIGISIEPSWVTKIVLGSVFVSYLHCYIAFVIFSWIWKIRNRK